MNDIIKNILVVLCVILSFLIILSFITIIQRNVKRNNSYKQIIMPEKYATAIVGAKKKQKKENKKDFFLVRMLKEYIFFFGNCKKVVATLAIGYSLFLIIMFLITGEILFSILISFSFFALIYVRTDNKITKKRKAYIKDFASAIQVLCTSAEAGNTVEASIKQVVERDTIGPRIRAEFANINKDLLNNMSLGEALEHFYNRNKMFQEIGMFVIIMQFYALKGGDGLKDILNDISDSLNDKITAYAEVQAELGIYTALMNVFVYGYFAIILGIQFIMPTFYPDMFDNGLQYVQAIASIGLYMFGIWFYKSMMRGTAEG